MSGHCWKYILAVDYDGRNAFGLFRMAYGKWTGHEEYETRMEA
jgi:hypothetical protein